MGENVVRLNEKLGSFSLNTFEFLGVNTKLNLLQRLVLSQIHPPSNVVKMDTISW